MTTVSFDTSLSFDLLNDSLNSFGSHGIRDSTDSNRRRSGSISGRLRAASDLEDHGWIDKSQKGVLKDLIISGKDLIVNNALDSFDRGEINEIQEILKIGLTSRRDSIDILEGLELDFLNVKSGNSDTRRSRLHSFCDEMGFSDTNPFAIGNENSRIRADSFLDMAPGNVFNDEFEKDRIFHPTSSIPFDIATNTAISRRARNMSLDSTTSNVSLNLGHFDYQNFAMNDIPLSSQTNTNEFEDMSNLFRYPVSVAYSENDLIVSSSKQPTSKRSKLKATKPTNQRPQSSNTGIETSNFLNFSKPLEVEETLNTKSYSNISKLPNSRQATYAQSYMIQKENKSQSNVFLNDNHMYHFSSRIGLPNTFKHSDNPDNKGLLGAYTPEQRRRRIQKFIEKRNHRIWTKKVKYDVRKNFADSRIRVKGRFVKKEEENVMKEMLDI